MQSTSTTQGSTNTLTIYRRVKIG